MEGAYASAQNFRAGGPAPSLRGAAEALLTAQL
jgi:hypothetical protein